VTRQLKTWVESGAALPHFPSLCAGLLCLGTGDWLQPASLSMQLYNIAAMCFQRESIGAKICLAQCSQQAWRLVPSTKLIYSIFWF